MSAAFRKHLFAAVAVAGWLAAATGPAAAQPGARIGGKVVDASGGVLPGVTVTARTEANASAPATQVTDAAGAFAFQDLPPGTYTLAASLPGFEEKRQTIALAAGQAVTQDFTLTLATFAEAVRVVGQAPIVDTHAPVGEAHVDTRVLQATPLRGERFDEALPLLPTTIRGPDGLLNMSGTRANQSVLLMNGVNGSDPVTGQVAFRLPLEAVQALDVQSGVQSAAYGDATGAITDVVTRPGQDDWDVQIQNFLPRFRIKEGDIRGIDVFTPRGRVAGPLRRGRLWLAESADYRFTRARVNELEKRDGLDRSEEKSEGVDSLTQIDYAVTPAHRLTGTFLWFPNNIDNLHIDTLHPIDATPDVLQRAWSVALGEHAVLGPRTTLETAFSFKQFNFETLPKTGAPSELTVTDVERNYFNHFDRDSRRYDVAAVLTTSRSGSSGDHLIKAGGSTAHTDYDGIDASLPVLVRRADGSLARRITFAGDPRVGASSNEVSAFVEDRWSPLPGATIHAGVRYGYDQISGDQTLAPRVDVAIRPSSGDRTVVKAGYGRLYDKLPLNAKDFGRHQRRRVELFDEDGDPIGSPVELANRTPAGGLRVPLSDVWNVEVDQLLAPDLVLRVGYQERHGRRELDIEPLADALSLSSDGRSRSRSLEVTVHRRLARHGELNVSYVRAQTRGSLNDFVSLFGNLRDPIIQPNEFSRQPFDVPNRFLAWGVVELPHRITLAPTVEYRTGFPYTVIDEVQDVAGSRNRGGRFPNLFTVDLQATKIIHLTKKRRAKIGLQLFNLTNHFNPRDVQNNASSPTFREFANGVEIQTRIKFVVLF